MEAPKGDVQGVQRFCRMVNCLSRYLPHLSDELELLQRLTVKGVPWTWDRDPKDASKKVKHFVTRAPALTCYNNVKELTSQCDASKDDPGSVPVKEDHPLAFGSRTQTSVEQRYVQIEKEFHQYTHRRKVTVIADHKPLHNTARASWADAT